MGERKAVFVKGISGVGSDTDYYIKDDMEQMYWLDAYRDEPPKTGDLVVIEKTNKRVRNLNYETYYRLITQEEYESMNTT